MSKQLLALILGTTFVSFTAAATTQPTAYNLYWRAAQILHDDDKKNIMSPAASNATFVRYYAPMPDDWIKMEKQDYDLHAEVRDLVHEAAQTPDADWPQHVAGQPYRYLNEIRNIANEIADAALYQSVVLKDQSAAFSSASDLFSLGDKLLNAPGENLVRLLVGQGIEALMCDRLMVMIANCNVSEVDRAQDLQLAAANQWIARLLDHPAAQAALDQVLKAEPAGAATNPFLKPSIDRILETIRRVQTERDFVAMSLAAHVYLYHHARWPANLDELKTEMPHLPIDPWGDGTQTLGYILIPGGMPDGSDRPLVYSRCQSADGLFYPAKEPEYSFYSNIYASHLPAREQKHGGQFRDVAAWPISPAPTGPATQPVN
jgi:hypothetical protein